MPRIESDLTDKDKIGCATRTTVAVMSSAEFEYSTPRLRRAHAMALAVDLWVRHRSMHAAPNGSPLSDLGRRAFAAGLIVGLSQLFVFDDRDTELVAYVYSLMDGAARDALILAAGLLSVGQEPTTRRDFLLGLEDAGKLASDLYQAT